MSETKSPEAVVREPLARPASVVSAATMVSRVLGLFREAVFAALFAAGGVADAFVFAFRIPNLLRDFLAEGALASAFVPTFSEVKAKQGEARAFELARRVFGTLGAVAGLIVLLGILFAPVIVSIVAPDARADLRPLTIRLTRIMFPFLILVSFAAVAMGVLNTYARYFVPALAPAFFNLVAVVGGAVLLLLGFEPEIAIVAWAALVVGGGALQFLIQLPLLRRIGFRGAPIVDLRFADPALRRVVRRMGPVVIGLAGTNVMLVITTALASREDGWAASLNYAFRLVHLPIGLVGVALGTILLAAGSRRSAADDDIGLLDVARRGLRLNWFLALPAAVGLFVLAEPLVRMVYERGRFGPHDTVMVAQALRTYAVGIVFYAGVKASAPLFIAQGDTRTPMLCSLFGIVTNLVVALVLIETYGHRALAFAVAVGAAANYGLLRFLGRRRFGAGVAPGWGFLARVVGAALVMGAVGWIVGDALLSRDGAVSGRVAKDVLTGVSVVLLGALYLVVSAALGVDEVDWFRSRLRRDRRA